MSKRRRREVLDALGVIALFSGPATIRQIIAQINSRRRFFNVGYVTVLCALLRLEELGEVRSEFVDMDYPRLRVYWKVNV